MILPTFTIISPLQAIINNGAKPILVDSCADTWNMDVNKVEQKITKNPKLSLLYTFMVFQLTWTLLLIYVNII